MICTKCGKELADNLAFCTGCGSPVSSVAPAVEAEATVMADSQSVSASAPVQQPLPTFGSAPAAPVQQPAPTYGSAPAQAPLPTFGSAPAAPVQPAAPSFNGPAPGVNNVYTAPPAPTFNTPAPAPAPIPAPAPQIPDTPEDLVQEPQLADYEGKANQAMIFGIIALALSEMGLPGIILSIIAKGKVNALSAIQLFFTGSRMTARYNSAATKLRLGRIFSKIALPLSIGMTIFYAFYFCMLFFAELMMFM